MSGGREVRGKGARGARHPDPAWDALRGIDEELRFHIEGRVEALIAGGVPEAEARARAEAAFGDVQRVREEMARIEGERARQETRRGNLLGLWSDVRIGARRLAHAPVLASAAVLTLALGIGASVAVFSVLDAVVLRPLPYPDPDRLMQLTPGRNMNIALARELSHAIPSVESSTGIARWQLTLRGEGAATTLSAEVVDAGFFDVFGVRPVLGRLFGMAETEPSGSDVVLLSHTLWQTRFGGDHSVVGKRLLLDGYAHESVEVIGVLPPGFRSIGQPADVWIPLRLAPGRTVASDSSWYVNSLIARVKPDVSVEQVTQETRAAALRLRELYPGLLAEEDMQSAGAVRLIDGMVSGVRSTLWLLLAAVGLVLLITCANLANLQLARAAGRRRDLALRAALGAGRGRLVREQLAESCLLALAGGVLGLGVATAALSLLRVAHASGLPRVQNVGLDLRALAFAIVVTGVCVVLFAVFPALRAAAVAPRAELHDGGRGATAGRGVHRVSRVLVVFEVALSMVLVSAAALVLASFTLLRAVDPGLDAEDVLAVTLVPSTRSYSGERGVQLFRDLEERIASMPGVSGVGSIQLPPFTGGNWAFPYLAEGQAPRGDTPLPSANFRIVTPGYFDAVDMPLLAGRRFDVSDRRGAPRVIILNETFARQLWPGQDPLGREVLVFGSESYRVIGIVGDVRQHTLDREPSPEMYVSHAQWNGCCMMTMLVEGPRATSLAPAIRHAVHELDPDIPISDLRPMTDLLGESLARRRFFASLLGAFGVLALVLGGVGVYGVTAHLVGSMLPDAGVRLALGATPSAVLRHAMWRGLAPAALGLMLGLIGALASARLLQSLLFGVEPIHPPTYAVVAVLLASVSLLATWLPCRRVARLDPLSVLRAQ